MNETLRFPLVCFDLDGTLVDDTVFIWKSLHEGFDTDAESRKKAHDDYFAGRISYEQWFENDLELLADAGAEEKGIRQLISTMRPMKGARETLLALRDRGHKVAIISGSLDVVVEVLFPDFEFDHMLINKLHFAPDGTILGGEPTLYDLEGKARGLEHLCALEGFSRDQTAFIGDNHNDVWIAKKAGLSVAFNCKSDDLRRVCDMEIESRDMKDLLSLLS